METCTHANCKRKGETEFRGVRFCLEHLTIAVRIAGGCEAESAADVAPSALHGLEAIPPGCKAFFLVYREQNAIYARGYDQPAVGIEIWKSVYGELPAFAEVERLWVVLNDNEDNRPFLISIANDKSVRRRCKISTLGVQWVTKGRLQWEQKQRYWTLSEEFRRSEDDAFEKIYQFQRCPTPSQIYKLDQLARAKKAPDIPHREIDWRT